MEDRMKKETVSLKIGVELEDINEAYSDASDNAWEHAKESSYALGIDMGDDEFVTLFQTINKNYEHNVDHLNFFMATALTLSKSIIEEDIVTIFTEDKRYTDREAALKINKLANAIVNSYMWLAGGNEITWLHNSELPEDMSIVFKLDKSKLIVEENEEE
jgi:hypothetical protein